VRFSADGRATGKSAILIATPKNDPMRHYEETFGLMRRAMIEASRENGATKSLLGHRSKAPAVRGLDARASVPSQSRLEKDAPAGACGCSADEQIPFPTGSETDAQYPAGQLVAGYCPV
jgi:hypothetical protein